MHNSQEFSKKPSATLTSKPSTYISMPLQQTLLALCFASLSAGYVTAELPPTAGLSASPPSAELDHGAAAELLLLEPRSQFRQPELENYLDALLARLGPDDATELHYRVHLVRDAAPSAETYPHGTIVLSTGLLARIDSEAQLAAVLAHEMAHLEMRRLVRLDDGRGGTTWPEEELLSDQEMEALFETLARARTADHGARLEEEAHCEAAARLRAQGYDLREALEIYQQLDGQAAHLHARPGDFRRIASSQAVGEARFQAQAPLVDERQFATLLGPVRQDLVTLSELPSQEAQAPVIASGSSSR